MPQVLFAQTILKKEMSVRGRNQTRVENFRMVDIGINALSTLFDNLKINLILQDYLKNVWKNDKIQINI